MNTFMTPRIFGVVSLLMQAMMVILVEMKNYFKKEKDEVEVKFRRRERKRRNQEPKSPREAWLERLRVALFCIAYKRPFPELPEYIVRQALIIALHKEAMEALLDMAQAENSGRKFLKTNNDAHKHINLEKLNKLENEEFKREEDARLAARDDMVSYTWIEYLELPYGRDYFGNQTAYGECKVPGCGAELPVWPRCSICRNIHRSGTSFEIFLRCMDCTDPQHYNDMRLPTACDEHYDGDLPPDEPPPPMDDVWEEPEEW